MLYTIKDIQNLYSKVVADYLSNGAVIDVKNSNYSSSGCECHTDFIVNGNIEIIELRKNWVDKTSKIRVVRKNKSGNEDINVIYTFYYYDTIYSDSKDEVEKMRKKQVERYNVLNPFENNGIPYNADTIIRIVNKRRGFKRIKKDDIIKVKRYGRAFDIIVNKKGVREHIFIGD